MRLSRVKRNIFANLAGTGLVTLLTILITPLQINILGIEAYGVVGFIATLQVMFAAFDLGLSSTLTRELAADPSLDKRASQPLLATASSVYWGAALVIGILVAAFAGPIGRWWFHADKLSTGMLVFSLRVIALYLALRWPAALYVGVLSGLQRMDILNLVKVLVAVVRLAGGIAVLLRWRSLEAFLLWTALTAVFEVGAYWLACRRAIPALSMLPGFSTEALRRVWRFSASMNALSIIAVLIIQMDRLVISKALPLETLGYYNLAYTMASGLALMIAAINSAIFPWFTEVQQGRDLLRRRYHDATFAMLIFVGLGAAILIFYGGDILALWVNPHAAAGAAIPTALLAFGFWVSAAITNVYNVAIACGRPQWHLKANLVSVVPYFLTLYALVLRFGASGAAIAWILLNFGYALYLVRPVHGHLLDIGVARWFMGTIMPPFALALACFGLLWLAVEHWGGGLYPRAATAIVSTGVYLLAGFWLLHGRDILSLPFVGALRSKLATASED